MYVKREACRIRDTSKPFCVCLKLKLVLKLNRSPALGCCPVLTVSSLFSLCSLITSSGLLTFAFSHYSQIGSCNQTGPVRELLLNTGTSVALSLKAIHSWSSFSDAVKQLLENSACFCKRFKIKVKDPVVPTILQPDYWQYPTYMYISSVRLFPVSR